MSRSRNIKPGFFKNELLVELPYEFRLLFVGIWTLADRDGRLEDRPTRIKMEVFPADVVDVDAGLKALHDSGFILRYQSDGRRFVQVLAWCKHQNPHMKEAKSTIPAPCLSGANPVPAQKLPEPAGLIPDSLIPDSLSKATVQLVAPDDRFGEFWDVYPRKQGKAKAVKAWKKVPLHMVDQIIAKVRRQTAEDDDWIRKFIPHPSTYINGERWNDEIAPPKTNGVSHVRPRKESLAERVTRRTIEEELRSRGNGTIGHDDAGSVDPDDGNVWPQMDFDIRGNLRG